MLKLIGALPLVWQLAIGAGLVGSLGGLYAVEHHRIYKSGYDAAIAAIAAENKEAIDAANALKAAAAACAGHWSQSRGVCE